MYSYEKRFRVAAAALLCTLGTRLAACSAGAAEFLTRPDVTAFLVYLQTGRDLRTVMDLEYGVDFVESAPAATLPPAVTPPTEPAPPETEPAEPVSASELQVYNSCGLQPDLQELLERPLEFADTDGAPMVLILSTHATESYRRGTESYAESSEYRTLDPEYNMLSIGARVAERLEAQGIGVLLDKTIHDYPSYNGSYSHARKTIQASLKEHPTIQLILDLHRDAADSGGTQLRTRATVDGQDSAQLMLVMGTDSGGLKHDHWERNLSLALKLQVLLENLAPGITRPLSLRAQRFNQDLSPGALLVEVGAAGNTRQEALRAAEVLAEAIGQLIENQGNTA